MKYFWLLILTAFCTNCAAQISAKDEPIAVLGAGQLSCGKWIAAREGKNEIQTKLFLQWMAGWVASYNYYAFDSKQRQVSIPDFESLAAFTDQFCKNNPLKFV
jgi:hypothetical protein